MRDSQLSAERERELVVAAEGGDEESRRQLVESFLPAIRGLARRFAVIANAETRAELMASRARVSAAGDEARRRIQRGLHDGAQQRLVNMMITLKLARRGLGDRTGPAAELVDEALAHAERANGEFTSLCTESCRPRSATAA